jgi:anti-sigma-K factor RskA
MSDDNHVLDSLPSYALGCLEGTEALRVVEHLGRCPGCRRELHAVQAVADQLALAAPQSTPPRELKRRLMDRVRGPRPAPAAPIRPPLVSRLLPAWAALSLLLVLALGGASLVFWQRANRLEGPTTGMRAVALLGTGVDPDASGYVVISADGQSGALVVDGLPQLDDAREQYQLWLVRDGQYTSGALFSVNERGYRGARIEAPDSLNLYSQVCISIEPTGGSPQPTGAQILEGDLRAP